MAFSDEQVDQSLDALAQELSVARLPDADGGIGAVLAKIKALKKQPISEETAGEVRALRDELLRCLEAIEKNAAEAVESQSGATEQLTPQQRAKIEQRFNAALAYVVQQGETPKGMGKSGLAWLARKRV